MSTHSHAIVATGATGTAPDQHDRLVLVDIVYHEVTCVFDGDPTSDDATVVGGIWLERSEAEDGDPFPCPVCGDEIRKAPADG